MPGQNLLANVQSVCDGYLIIRTSFGESIPLRSFRWPIQAASVDEIAKKIVTVLKGVSGVIHLGHRRLGVSVR